MAEETQTPEPEAPTPAAGAEVVVTLAEEKPAVKEEATPAAESEAAVTSKLQAVEEKPAVKEAAAPPADLEPEALAEPQAAEEKPAVEEAAALPAVSEAEVPAKPRAVEEKLAVKEAAPPLREPEADAPMKPHAVGEAAAAGKKKRAGIPLSVYFKEESNVVEDLEDSERKALDELKQLVRAALATNEFTGPPPPKPEEVPSEVEVKEEDRKKETKQVGPTRPEEPSPRVKAEDAAVVAEENKAVAVDDDDEAKTMETIEETVVPAVPAAPPPPPPEDENAPPPPPAAAVAEVSLWGVPLLRGEKSDTVLLKFLRARDFRVRDALSMLKDTVTWREEFGIDGLLEEDLRLPEELEKAVFMQGKDREGHPVCYNVYGELQEKGVYSKLFADERKRQRFLRWRIQVLEKGIREHLDFGPTGVCSMVQVTDLKDSPVMGRWELRQAMKKALGVFQDNYPEFVAKQVFINVPWWYLAFNRMISPFLTQRTKSKFVFAGPSRSSETLFEYIAPEQVPVQFGGLSRKGDPDFTTSDAVAEVTVKPSSKHTLLIPVSEACLLVWELRVLGWEVSYGAEFVPRAEGGYTVIVQKERRLASTDEPLVKNSFKVGEPGQVVLTVDNTTSRKKKLLYRCKVRKFA